MALQYNDIVTAQQGMDREAIAAKAQQLVAPTTPTPASSAISVDQLGTAQAIKVPTLNPDSSAADGLVQGANQATKGIDAYLKELTPPETEASKTQSDLMTQINSLLPQTANKATDQLATEKQLGIPQLKKQLADLNSQILSRTAQYEKQFAQAETQAVPNSFIIGTQAAVRRAQAADIGLLQARALGLQGQVEMAQSTADRAIDLKYDSLQDTINVKMQQLELIQPILDKEERRFAEALNRKYTEEREKLAEEKEKAKQNIALALEAGLSTKFVNRFGEFFRTSDGKPYSSPEEFFKDAGVRSFEEAYQRGLIGDYNPDLQANRSIIADMITKYPDAGITLRDTIEEAQGKLRGSRIYGDQVRPPMGSGGGGGSVGTVGTGLVDANGKPLRLTAGQVDTIAGFDNTTTAAQEALNILQQGVQTGPIAGRVLQGAKLAGSANPQQLQLEQVLGKLRADFMKAISGAAVSENEVKRLSSFLPSINDQESVIQSKLNTLMQEVSRNKSNFLSTLGASQQAGPVAPAAQPTAQPTTTTQQPSFWQKTFNFLFGD